jgi:hypothetical protein
MQFVTAQGLKKPEISAIVTVLRLWRGEGGKEERTTLSEGAASLMSADDVDGADAQFRYVPARKAR